MSGTERDESIGIDGVTRETVAKTLLGFAVAVVLVYLLGAVVGWDRALERLRAAQAEWIAVACLSTLLCLAAWAKTWQLVLETIGVAVPLRKLVVTFYAATFANYVTPMGQAGGEPFIAYVLARDTAATYEQSLASVVAADLLRLLPFFTAGGIGFGYLLFTAQLRGPTEQFALLLAVLAAALPALAVVGWRFRDRVRDGVLRGLAPVARRTDRLSIASIGDRIDRLYGSLEVIADSPRALLVSLALAYVGWILFALPLYFAGLAIGTPVPLLLVCFLVPASVIAGSAPLPGGLAAIEGTLLALLTALTALSTADALAVVTIYRLASYWLVVALGGVAALWVIRRA